jgi:hypothetical protein
LAARRRGGGGRGRRSEGGKEGEGNGNGGECEVRARCLDSRHSAIAEATSAAAMKMTCFTVILYADGGREAVAARRGSAKAHEQKRRSPQN